MDFSDHFFSPIYNMPKEQKKAFEEQLKVLNRQQETIRSLVETTRDQLKIFKQQQETIESLVETTEKQATLVKSLLNETEKQGKRSGIQGKLSLIFAIAAVLIAGLAAWFSFQDFKSDEIWQHEQIKILEEIRQSINYQD